MTEFLLGVLSALIPAVFVFLYLRYRERNKPFNLNEVAMPDIDRGPYPELAIGFRIEESEIDEDGVRVITSGRIESINIVDKPLHPSWTIESVENDEKRLDRLIQNDVEHVYRKDRPLDPDDEWDINAVGPLFKHRGKIPEESSLSYTKEELLDEGRRLASQRDDLIAHGADPAELSIPLAPMVETNIAQWICTRTHCRTDVFGSEAVVDWDDPHSKDGCPECNTISFVPNKG